MRRRTSDRTEAARALTGGRRLSRRVFLKGVAGGAALTLLGPFSSLAAAGPEPFSRIFRVRRIPEDPFYGAGNGHYHAGIDSLLQLMGENGLKFYRTLADHPAGGPEGMIAADDVVLIKVNGQWKYRGCTNSDVIRGLVQRILDHPDGFTGEVVIVENGQGRGSLNCDTSAAYGNTLVRANANDRAQSFRYLVDHVFDDPRVSAFLLDPIRETFIAADDHTTNGYRRFQNVSYPCFTTRGLNRVELKEGVWDGAAHRQNLKLLNVPVLKHHDVGGSELTGTLKHLYGLLSMADGNSAYRHYAGLGRTCGKMVVSVRAPVLNILDCIWVSHGSIKGYPSTATHRWNNLVASQDPVALDWFGARYLLYPIDGNRRHHPDFPTVHQWLAAARDVINERGGIFNPAQGVLAHRAKLNPANMRVFWSFASTAFTF